MPSQSSTRAMCKRLRTKKLVVVKAGTKDDLNEAFTAIIEQHGGALVVQTDPFLPGQRDQIVALAAHHAVPAILLFKRLPGCRWPDELRHWSFRCSQAGRQLYRSHSQG